MQAETEKPTVLRNFSSKKIMSRNSLSSHIFDFSLALKFFSIPRSFFLLNDIKIPYGLALIPTSGNARCAVFLSYLCLSIYMTELYSAMVFEVYFVFAQIVNCAGLFADLYTLHSLLNEETTCLLYNQDLYHYQSLKMSQPAIRNA